MRGLITGIATCLRAAKMAFSCSVDGDGIFTDTVFWAKSEAHLPQLKTQYEIPADARTIVYPA